MRNTLRHPTWFEIGLLKQMLQSNMMNRWLLKPTLSLQRQTCAIIIVIIIIIIIIIITTLLLCELHLAMGNPQF